MHTPATENADGRDTVDIPRYEVNRLSLAEQDAWRSLGFPVPDDVAKEWARRTFTGGDVGPCRIRVRSAKEIAGEAERNRKRRASREHARRKAAQKRRAA